METIDTNLPVTNKDNQTEKKEKKPGTVLFSGFWHNSADLIVSKLQEFEQQNKNEVINKTLFIIKDMSLADVGSGRTGLYEINEQLNKRWGPAREGRTNVQIIREIIKKELEKDKKDQAEKEMEWKNEFYDYVDKSLSEEDIEERRNGVSSIEDCSVVALNEEALLNFLKSFLKTKGYDMEMLSSYKRIPKGYAEYKKLCGVLSLQMTDEDDILKEISER